MFFLLSYDDFLKANFKKSIVLSYDTRSKLYGLLRIFISAKTQRPQSHDRGLFSYAVIR